MKVSHDSETPAHGQQVITVCAFIHHKFDGVDKVFLARRAATKKFLPNIYELPGGHLDFGEEPVPGLIREVKEEFQKTIAVGDPFAAFTYTNPIKGSHSVEVIYFAQFTDGPDGIVLEPEDHQAYGWFSQDEAEKENAVNRSQTDPEIETLKTGFALLRGEKPRFS